MQNNQYIVEETNNIIINEEFGISNELDNKIEEIVRYIEDNINSAKTCNSTVTTNNTPKQYKKLYFINNFFGIDLPISAVLYIFENVDQYKTWYNKTSMTGGFIDFRQGVIIYGGVVNNKVCFADLFDTIGHELEHVYQKVKAKKTQKDIEAEFFSNRNYNIAKSDLNRIDKPYNYNIATIIYIGNNSEQDAFINGLYQDVKWNKDKTNLNDIILNSEATIWLKRFYSAVDFIKKNFEQYDLVDVLSLKYRILNKNTFLKQAEQQLKRYQWKYGRAVYYCKRKFLSESVCILNKNMVNPYILY